MKKTLIFAGSLICLLLLGLVAGSPKAMASPKVAWEVKWNELVEAAKKEGEVMIYGRGDPEVRKSLRNAFTGKYGVDLEFLYFARGGEMTARIKKERGASLYIPDVIIHGTGTLITLLKPAGILDPLGSLLVLPEVTDPKVWRVFFMDKDCMVKPMRTTFMRFAIRNTNLVKEGELTSYRDLLDPKWKGKMVMGDPSRPSTTSAFVTFLHRIWGRDKTVEFLRQLVKQEPVISRESRLPLEWVARGKYPIGIGMRNEPIPEFLKAGAPLALVKMAEGVKLAPGAGNLAIVNKCPHPNATALFINWILTMEGQTIWSKADGYPSSRLDVSTEWINPVFLPDPDEKICILDEADYKASSEQWNLSKEIFTPLLK